MDTPLKRCTKCSNEFPTTIEFFCRDHRVPSGLRSQCKSCERRYREQNSDRIKQQKKNYHAEHQNANRNYDLVYRRNNPAKINTCKRDWIARNPERNRHNKRAAWARRRVRIFNAEGTHTSHDIKRQYNAQKGRCYWCGKKTKAYHVDHVIPLSRGGSNGPENIVIACPTCNTKRQNKLPHEWEGNNGKLL